MIFGSILKEFKVNFKGGDIEFDRKVTIMDYEKKIKVGDGFTNEKESLFRIDYSIARLA